MSADARIGDAIRDQSGPLLPDQVQSTSMSPKAEAVIRPSF